jgi:hypothetical protein
MSRGVSMFGAGATTAPMRIAPSTAAYQAGTRGSITKTRSPLPIPAAASARAQRRDSRARSLTVCSATTPPAPSSETSATASGSRPAHASTMSIVGLKASGTSSRKLAYSLS